MNSLGLEYALPPDDVAPFVSTLYRFRAEVPLLDDLERADRAQFRFRLSPGSSSYSFLDGGERPAPPVHILSPTRGVTRTRAHGPVHVFGLGLTPCGWAAIVGRNASDAENRVLSAEALWGEPVRRTFAALRLAPDFAAMIDAALPLIRGLIGRADPEVSRFCHAVDAWLQSAVSPELDLLEQAAGLTRRQVERRCNALYGMPPKVLARKYRALRAAAAIAVDDADAEELALGFYDQSHMIREVKQFTGMTPGELRRQRSPLMEVTVNQRRALDGRAGPLVTRT